MNSQSKPTPVTRCVQIALSVLLLSSCASTETGSGVSTGASQPGMSNASATPANQSQAIPVLAGPARNNEQEALIAQINRDGVATRFPGLNDTAPQPVEFEGDNVVELNYEQADYRDVITELAEALDVTILIDPSIDRKVSMRTAANRPLALEDVWPLIRLLSRDAGVLIERVGNVYNARLIQSNLPVEISSPEALDETTGARIMQVTPLTYVSNATATEVISPVLEPDGTLRSLPTTNTLLITATPYQLERVNQLLALVDADPFANRGIQLFPLDNGSATEIAAELVEILQLIEGPNPSYQVKGIERINAILVTAPAGRGFDEIARWVRIMDADSQEQVEQLFYYRVRNLSAVELATTLSAVFEEDDNEEETPEEAEEDPVTNQFIVPGFSPSTAQAADGGEADSGAGPAAGGGANAAVSADLRVKIVADESTNSLLIRSTARDYRQLLTTINQLDSVPLQVMINAVIAQITLSENNDFGVDWSRIAADSAVNDISTSTSTSFLPGAGLGGVLFSKSFIDGAAQIDATLEAISSNNEVSLLARPTLTVTNNQEGEIQIGSQVPVEQGQTVGGGGVATTNIQYRDTGIVLAITPQINGDGVVNLVIRQELSSVDTGAGGVNGNPVFNNQEINTTVVVRNGENVVLGGLIQDDTEDLNTGVPFLNRVPVVGNLFSYQQRGTRKQELFIVLRPEIIDLNNETSVQYTEILDRFEMVSELLDESIL